MTALFEIIEQREDYRDGMGWIRIDQSFVRSNGTIIARLYERLTKASRRRFRVECSGWQHQHREKAYRKGVYDAYKALQNELEQ